MTELTFSPEQQAAIDAARARRQTASAAPATAKFSPEQQAAIDAARKRRESGQQQNAGLSPEQVARQADIDALAEFEMYNPGAIERNGYKTAADLPARGESFPPVGTGGRSGVGPGGIVQGPGMSSNEGLAYGVANALSLGMGQEMAAGVDAIISGTPYREKLAEYEKTQTDAQGSGGYGAGNVLGSLTPVGVGGKFVQAAQSLPGAMMRSGLVGAGYGAVTGAGEQGSAGERIISAAKGAATGGVFGGLLPGVVAGATRLLGGKVAPSATVAASAPVAAKPAAVQVADDARLGDLMKRAARGSEKAKIKLAEEIRINPEAKAAAERLGIELPADVLGDNIAAAEMAGLSRAQLGTEPSAQWWGTVKDVRDKADDILAKVGGGADLSTLSDDVKGVMDASRGKLKDAEDFIWGNIRKLVPESFSAKTSKTKTTLDTIYRDMGGREMMRPEEKKLFETLAKAGMTFGGLRRAKSAIGAALGGMKSPFEGVDRRDLSRLYGALSDDMGETIALHGSGEAKKLWEQANKLTVQRKTIEDNIETAFGKDGAGSLAAKMRSALTGGSKGDAGNLMKMLGAIPADMRGRALATSIGALTRSARSSEPGFGLPEFSKFMAGLNTNKAVKAQFVKALGKEAMGLLDDLQIVSQRVAMANARIPKTGASMQGSPVYQAFSAPGMVEGLFSSTTGKGIVKSVAGGAGYALGGPVGIPVGVGLSNVLTRAKEPPVKALSAVLQSPEFKALATSAAMKRATPAAVELAAKSGPMRRWAKLVGIDNPKDWLLEAAKAGQTATDMAMRAGVMATSQGEPQ